MKRESKLHRRALARPRKWKHPGPREVRRAAQDYVASGLSLIPIQTDGTKSPAFSVLPTRYSEKEERYKRVWGPFRLRIPTPDELQDWFPYGEGQEPVRGMAIVLGRISGGLEVIDFDLYELAKPWKEAVAREAPDLLGRLVMVRTPRPGLHVYYRSAICQPGHPLAHAPEPDPQTGKPRRKATIELKGERNLCVAPPTPRGLHRKGYYRVLDGKDLTMIPTITADERELLLTAARALNQWVEPPRKSVGRCGGIGPVSRPRYGLRPGDDFNQRANWADILEPHGWRHVGTDSSGVDQWCRPGKDSGKSATTDFEGNGLLHVFSANADPFEADRSYTKFAAFALLKFGGDYGQAAHALYEMGYGRWGASRAPAKPVSRLQALLDRYAKKASDSTG